MNYYFVVLAGVFACSVSQLLLKENAIIEHKNRIEELINWRVIISYGIMFIVLMVNVCAMKNGVMLKDMPVLEATGYVFVPILSFLILHERIEWNQILSIALIILGILVFYT